MATVARTASSAEPQRTDLAGLQTSRVVMAHIWVAIAVFGVACLLGVWQMWARSPLNAPYHTAANYFRSVTLHGVSMGYVLTTFFIMGFGYYVAETALKRPLPSITLAWGGFWLGILGTLMTVLSVTSGNASVLFTFYPPLTATPWFYIGLVLVVVASWLWCAQMIVAMRAWKAANPGEPVPLAMFATVANAVMWLWTTVGVAAELLFQVIPAAFGWSQTLDVGLSRTLFSWTLHAIVYFWLFPSYIAFYTMFPRAAGGRLYSDTLGRLAFILFIIYSLPVGLHHLFMDPEHSNGFKFLQMFLTALVSVPTLLTIFTISASAEIAGRMRGGNGLFGWIGALPWNRPMVLATGLALGIAPALSVGRADPQQALREETRGMSESHRSRRLRGVLVAGQIALCVSLLAGAGLLVRSLVAMTSAPAGFDPRGVLTMGIQLPGASYRTDEARARFFEQLEERVRGLPGVTNVAA